MKKVFLIGLIVCVCIALSACAATDPENLFETTLGNSGTESTQAGSEEVTLHTGTYQYGNMQKNLPSGNFMLLGNEVIFQHAVSNSSLLLYCYDLVTEEVRPYCKDATCRHGDCASGIVEGNLEVYKGKLYASSAPELKDRPGIVFQPVVLNGDKAEAILPSAGKFFHHDDKMYICTADSSFAVLEEGQSEPRVIIEEYTGYWNVIFGDYLYANTSDSNIIRTDLTAEEPQEEVVVTNAGGITDGQYIYYIDQKTYQFYRCDMDGSNAQLLVDQPVLLASLNFDDEYFYYRLYTGGQLNGNPDSYDLYRFPKEDPTQIEKIITLPVSAYQVFTVPGTGKIFVTTHAPEGEDRPVYVMGTDGSDMKLLEIPG